MEKECNGNDVTWQQGHNERLVIATAGTNRQVQRWIWVLLPACWMCNYRAHRAPTLTLYRAGYIIIMQGSYMEWIWRERCAFGT